MARLKIGMLLASVLILGYGFPAAGQSLSPRSDPQGAEFSRKPGFAQSGSSDINSGSQKVAILPTAFSPDSPPPTMTFDQLEEIAVANNPTLTQASRRIEVLRGRRLQVGLYPNPRIGYAGEEIGDEGRGGLQGGFFSQEIVTAGKLRWNRTVVEQEIAEAEQQYRIQQLRIRNDVRTTAYEALAAERRVELNEEMVRIGEEGVEIAEQLLKAQEVSRSDLLQARIESNTSRIALENAQNDLKATWKRLAFLMGLGDLPPRPLVAPKDDAMHSWQWEACVERLLAESPELAVAQQGVAIAKSELNRQCARRVPNFNIEGGILYNNGSQQAVASAGLSTPLQLYDRNQGNIMAAQSDLVRAQQEVRRMELALQHRLADVFREYINAREQVRRYREELLPDAKSNLELVQQGYRQGEFGYLELLTGQRTFFRVNLAYVESLQDLSISSTRIEGLLLTGGLEKPR